MVKVRGEVPREFFDWYQKEIFRDDGTDIDWMSKVDISEEEEEECQCYQGFLSNGGTFMDSCRPCLEKLGSKMTEDIYTTQMKIQTYYENEEEEEEEWDGACPYCESDDLDWKDSHTPIGNPESYDTWECQECQKEINVLSITKQYLELEKEEEECCKK